MLPNGQMGCLTAELQYNYLSTFFSFGVNFNFSASVAYFLNASAVVAHTIKNETDDFVESSVWSSEKNTLTASLNMHKR